MGNWNNNIVFGVPYSDPSDFDQNSGDWIQICCRIFAGKHRVRQVSEDIPQLCSRVLSFFMMQRGAP